MKKWEYTTGSVPANKQAADKLMNGLGDEGWELVSVIVTPDGQVVSFFKRPKGGAVMSGDEFERIRPEIRALVERGNITPAELLEIRCNSWEWEALVPAMTDEAFVERMQYSLDNCFTRRERPFTTYNQAVEGLWAPELLKRFQSTARAARDYAETIDNVREALGQDGTHYLITADDVSDLVKAVELDAANTVHTGGCHAGRQLLKLRENNRIRCIVCGATQTPLDGCRGTGNPCTIKKCLACSIESEIGTEENPHPVPNRFHTCPPTYQNAEFGVHIFAGPEGFKSLYERTPDGHINNCALANGDERKNCQVCKEQCPDRARFR